MTSVRCSDRVLMGRATCIDEAPLRDLAGDLFFVAPTMSRAFPESAGGALAVANLLAALTVAKLGENAQKRIRLNERRLVDAGEYLLTTGSARKRGTANRRSSSSGNPPGR